MKSKSLLGAIIGDILRETFSDKKFVYDPVRDKPILSEKSKISGYTVITLAVAKYIMEYNHLYEGRSEPGRSKKRKELLCKTILDLAKDHPELDYPEWLNKWLASDKYIPTKESECMAGLCLEPLFIYFTHRADLESTLRVITESISVITSDSKSILGTKAVATAIYSNKKYGVSGTQDFMACLYNIRWAQELSDIDSNYGWNTSLLKAIGPALSVFYQGDNELRMNEPVTNLYSALYMTNKIDGLPTLATPIVTTMMQAEIGWWNFDEVGEFRSLLPKDLLEINDKFFEFSRKLYDGLDEDEDGDGEDGSSPFSDLLKLL